MDKEFNVGDFVQVRSLAWFDSFSTCERVSNGDFGVERVDFRKVAGCRVEICEVDNGDHTIRVQDNEYEEIWIPTICVEGESTSTSNIPRRDRKLKNRVRF